MMQANGTCIGTPSQGWGGSSLPVVCIYYIVSSRIETETAGKPKADTSKQVSQWLSIMGGGQGSHVIHHIWKEMAAFIMEGEHYAFVDKRNGDLASGWGVTHINTIAGGGVGGVYLGTPTMPGVIAGWCSAADRISHVAWSDQTTNPQYAQLSKARESTFTEIQILGVGSKNV